MNMHISPHRGPPSAFEAFTGTPLPKDPIRALKRLRAAAAADVLRLIAFLDETDGDPDLDDDELDDDGLQDREPDPDDADSPETHGRGWYDVETASP